MDTSTQPQGVLLLFLKLFGSWMPLGLKRDKQKKMSFYTQDWKNGTKTNDNNWYQIV